MREPVVLIYHMAPQRQAVLSGLCASMRIRPVTVPDSEGKVPIGLLTGQEDPVEVIREAQKRTERVAKAGAIREEMIVMAGFDDNLFSSFLRRIRENGLAVSLKAVQTRENRFWNGEVLQEELKKERSAFRSRQ